MQIDKSRIDTIEGHIAPPMRTAITLPTNHKNVVIYVSIGAFAPEVSQEEMDAAVTEVAQALQLDPSAEQLPFELQPLPDFGDHMTWQDFIDAVDAGGFNDDDGCGDLATVDRCSNIPIHPSDVAGEQARAEYKRPGWATHVVWYNK